jgi:hypothetical protein
MLDKQMSLLFAYLILGPTILMVAVSVAIASGFILYGVSFLLSSRPKEEARRVSLRIAMVTVLGVFLLTSYSLCQSLLLSDPTNPPRRKPAQEDIIGVWSPTPACLEWMQEEGGYRISTHTLTFRQDGTLEMTNMPDWWLNFGDSSGGFYSCSGTWKIDKVNDKWAVDVHFTSFSSYQNGFGTSFGLSGQKPPYRIYIGVGDPDDADFMVFERR